jgi:hypothetical protein
MLLEESGINPEVVRERGYRTVESEAELARLGFGRAQRAVPALLVPIYGPGGQVVLHQARPDEPRKKDGKPIKYETPAGVRMAFDVHPRVRERLSDPSVRLWITEGVKKGDALVSRGECAIALPGVWNWRGRNDRGGRVALGEWEHTALNGRRVYIAYDSDVMQKPEVYGALSRLKAFLEGRGAKVYLVYLPDAEDGSKQGVDDFLAAGHSLEELIALATTELRPPPARGQKPTQSELLIRYTEEAELFHDLNGDNYATVEVDDHSETWPIKSERFKGWLLRRYYRDTGKAPSAQAMTEARTTIAAMAAFDSDERRVFTRVAKYEDAVYVDLCNARWEAVEVTPSGWRVLSSEKVPVKFVRKGNAASLPNPVEGGSLEALRQFLNVRTEEDFRLLVAWVVGALNPDGPYPVLVLQGEQGSAKSTTVRVARSITDPAVEPLRAPPRDERDLAIAASGNWTPALDNLSGVRPWLSDALCRLATGGGFATRELYSDDREVVFSQKRPVILNGIDSLAVAGDLRDRSLIVELPPIPPERKRTEKGFFRELEQARPLLLGALLDAVSAALRNLDRVQLARLPRMADFAVWISASEEALPWEPGVFMEAYAGNRSEANELALDNDPVAVAIRRLLSDLDEWSGTSTELLAALRELVDEPVTRSKAWPAAPNSLSNRLKRIAPALREAGIEYQERTEGRDKRRVKNLKRSPKETVRTARSEESVRDDAFNGGRSAGDADDGERPAGGVPGGNRPSGDRLDRRSVSKADDADGGTRTESEDERVRFSL